MKRRRIWGAAATAVAVLAGVLASQAITGHPDGHSFADGKPGPVKSAAQTAQLQTSGDGSSAVLGQRATKPFSMLGVTWTDPAAKVTGAIEARTRDVQSGEWSKWLRLDGDSGQGEGAAVRGGTEPAWVGPSDGVEVRVHSGGQSSSRLPAGLRLDMIDPGTGGGAAMGPAAYAIEESAEPSTSSAPEPTELETTAPEQSATTAPEVTPTEELPTEPSASESPTATETSQEPSPTPPTTAAPSPSTSSAPTVTVPPAPPSTAPRPPVVSRADWGADESISPEEPGYLPGGKIKAVVVHHTAESNSYSCEQAPALVRGIYAYHVKQLGWKDLGYNFLVDKCGTVYEGRKGGVDQPVQGAHAYGFNAETTGISVLGTYTDVAPSQAAMMSVAKVAAWKLGQYGVDPASTATLTAGDAGRSYSGKTWSKGAQLSFPAIHGHRDGYNTQCPGNAFYGQLGTIRSWAAGPVTGLAIKSVTGAGLSGTTYYTKADATVNWSATTPVSLIKQYELLVDGKPVVTTAATATSAKTTLTIGRHTVAVRATHQSGKQITSAATTVVAEISAPSFTTKPSLALRVGTVDTSAVPVTLSWKATDGAALKETRLTTPLARAYGPTLTSASHTAKSATTTAWNMTAYDVAGNTATASAAGTPVILQETAAVKSGTWSTKSSTSYLGGKSFSSSATNASLTWTFTGRSAAWVVSRASTSGQAHVYVDGVKAVTLDLKSATTKFRDAIWTKTWATSAKHTIKIVIVGTAGRPAVTTDGLVYLK
ncbi:N-acetylmuramoyl-L-alanine amidase [Streptomyces sp. CA-252508]|uniref:peptidoglycan recognition protein family protein n=1 Tax=Streptomyces sp. CA-252508 TaxID=3418946 RepID=UPI003D90A5A2